MEELFEAIAGLFDGDDEAEEALGGKLRVSMFKSSVAATALSEDVVAPVSGGVAA